MGQWAPGSERVQDLLASGDVQKIQGSEANGQPLLDKAIRTLTSANALQKADPDSSYTLAYDAARFACTALLAQHGFAEVEWSEATGLWRGNGLRPG